MIDLVITLLIFALVVVIAFFILRQLGLPAEVFWIVQLILGVLFLIYLLDLLFGGGHLPAVHLR